MSMSFKASPDGLYGEILVNGQVVAKLPLTGNAVIPGLVGTVSQVGGVPTGAVVERGSNANGEYVRFADGTQICHIGSLVSGTGGAITWTFPAVFSVAPQMQGTPRRGAMAAFVVDSVASTTAVTLSVYDVAGTRIAVGLDTAAIGRWF